MAETATETGKRGRKAAIKAEKAQQAAADGTKPKTRGKGIDGGPTFWQKIASVAKEDWGPRVNIYLYRCEPITDRRRSGNYVYVTRYSEPISEERVLADHGSGRYKLMLNFRKPGAEQGDELDSIYLELLNLQYPPKIPPGEWVDDPNNKKWAWAKQHFPKEGGTNGTAPDLVQALDVLNEIQDSTTKRVMANLPPPTSGADEVVKLAKVIDTIRPPAPPPLPPDNSLAVFMQGELRSIREQVEKSRERELALMEKLMDARTTRTETGGLTIVKELVGGLKELLPEVKALLPASEDGGNWGGRNRPWWQEVAVMVAPYAGQFVAPIGSVLAQGIAAKMMSNGNGATPAPHPNPVPNAGQLPSPVGTLMMPFLQMIAVPMQTHIRYMAPPDNEDPAEVGADFARWVYNGYGANPNYEPAVTAAKAMGPVGILAAFRSTPLWGDKGPQNTLPSLAELEPKLTAFFTAFLNWDSQADEPPEESESDAPEVLTYSGK